MPWYRIVNPEVDLEILRKRKVGEETILSAFQYLRCEALQDSNFAKKLKVVGEN